MSPPPDKTPQSNHDYDSSRRGVEYGCADEKRSNYESDSSWCHDYLLKNSIVEDNSTTLSDDGKRYELEDGIVEISSDSEVEGPDTRDYWLKNLMVVENCTTLSDNGNNGKRYELEDGIVEISSDNEVEGPDRRDLMGTGKNDRGNVVAETSSDSVVEVVEKAPDCDVWKYTSIADSIVVEALMGDDDLQYLGERSKPENPQFRKDVEDILRRPYDEKEYETLWVQVSLRKPMLGYRELRGRLRTYEKDTLGKSYLDEYSDLQKKLDTFDNDLPKKLNVLRGFFYYLQKMADDGIFKPWLDESCGAIVPTSE